MVDEKFRIFRRGLWDGDVYKNGESEIVYRCLRSLSFDAFIKMIHEVVRADCRLVEYTLHFMTSTENGAMEKCRILCEGDLHRLADTCMIPTIYVSLEPKNQLNTRMSYEVREDSSSFDVVGGAPHRSVYPSRMNDISGRQPIMRLTSPPISEHPSFNLGNEFQDSPVLPNIVNCGYFQDVTHTAEEDDDRDEDCDDDDEDNDFDDDNNDEDSDDDPDFEIDDPLEDLFYESYGWKADEFFVSDDADCDDAYVPETENVVDENDETTTLSGRSAPIHVVPPIDITRSDNTDEEVPFAQFCNSNRGWMVPAAPFHYPEHVTVAQESDNGDCELFKGAIVGSKLELEIKVGFYHLNNRVEYRTPRSSKTRLDVVCRYKNRGCGFLCRGRKIPGGSWKVSKFVAPHTCKLDLNACRPRQVHSKVIAAFFAPKLILEGRSLRPKDIMFDIYQEYSINITYSKALTVYHKAYSFIYGEHSKSWQLMPGYFHLLGKENPGTYTNFETDDNDMFKYSFFALGASIKGFNEYCRPIIVVDGTFLKGKSKGVLFVAVTKDANEQVFPLAFGLADKEKDESWVWFMQQLRNAFGCRENLVIVSDRHQSIKNAVEQAFGVEAIHAICSFHLRQNIKHYRQHVVSLFHQASYTYSPDMFQKTMKHLKIVNSKAHNDLMQAGPERWARSQCPVRRYTFMTSNSAETLNGRLIWARKLPVCSLFEAIRHLLQDWFHERRIEAEKTETDVSINCYKRLTELRELAQKMEIESLGGKIYHVKDRTHFHVVDLEKRTCTCCVFQVDLLPCSHAIKAISQENHSLYSYVHAYYKTDTLRKLWSPIIMPVSHPSEWDLPDEIISSVVKPLIVTRQPGRPRFRRVASTGLSSRKRKAAVCSRCLIAGHNSATCTADIPNAPIAQKSGRARRRCGVCKLNGHTRKKCPDLELTL